MMAKPSADPPPATLRSARADARRNYERLVAAAHEVFTEQGANASLEEIARRAGLGSATLHRHFPNRYTLMEAVYWNQIEALCTMGRDQLASASPDDALVTWLHALIAIAAERGLATALMTSRKDKATRLFDACHDAIRAAAAPLFSRAQQLGTVRAGIELDDLLHLTNAIALTIEHDPSDPERADRLLALLVEGLQNR
jgi:AcrR family transcriptional regulator